MPLPHIRRAVTGAGAALALALASCAGPNSERNLAPVFSSYSAAGGAPEVEALGGMLASRRDAEDGRRRFWAVRPIVSSELDEQDDDRQMWLVPPMGWVRHDWTRGYRVIRFMPLFRYYHEREDSGAWMTTLLIAPNFYRGTHQDGRPQFIVFPFIGVMEGFFSLDRGMFAMFPLWFRMERYGRKTDHFLWPFFTIRRGTGGFSWRAWPLITNNRWEGRYNRWTFLWPFFHWHKNDLQFPEEQHQTSWMVWPLIGRATRGPASETTFLWPFFGYSTDPETGFYAWDGPWFLVRFQGGDPNRPVRKRVLPFFSYYTGDGLTSRWWAWPIVNKRHEDYANGTKDSFIVFPFWRQSDRYFEPRNRIARGPERNRRFRKLWPLGKSLKIERTDGTTDTDFSLVDLNPLQEFAFIDEHYAWMWELYTRRAAGDEVQSRSWLGLWRREKDRDEDRRSFSAVWSARDYDRAGRRAHERSWLFGILRYRWVEGGGFSLLRPAFPGPGWPIQRVPASKVPVAGGER